MSTIDKERFYNQRSDKFTIVLNDNECDLFHSAENIKNRFKQCDSIGLIFIACIKHDKDYDVELKQYKTTHYHVVIQLDKIVRVLTMINLIMNTFHCNENQISIDKCNSICMQTRYLIHLDDFDKYQYFPFDIACNDNNVLQRYLSLVIVRDIHDLIARVKQYHYDLETIMQNISHYDKWRKYINDLIINHNRKF